MAKLSMRGNYSAACSRPELRISLNAAQSIGTIGGLVLTLAIAVWNGNRQANQVAADLMLRFDDKVYSGKSGLVANSLDMNGDLNQATGVDDEAIEQFLNNYELLAAVYSRHLIDRDLAEDAFSYELKKRSEIVWRPAERVVSFRGSEL
jgi:hypothetical protein